MYCLSFLLGMAVLLCMTAIAANSFRRGMEGLGRGIHAGGRDLGSGISQGMVRAAMVRLVRTLKFSKLIHESFSLKNK